MSIHLKMSVGNPHRRGGRLLIGCRPDRPMEGLSERGPEQDAGAVANGPARPEDEGIGTDDAPQGGGLDRALSPGPHPGQPGWNLEPGPDHPSTHPLDSDRVEGPGPADSRPANGPDITAARPDTVATGTPQ